MGALYEDVENFFGDIFAWYGRRVARRPLPFVIVPVLVCSLLGLGLFNIRFEADLEKLYTPINSRAIRDRQTLRRLFGPYSSPGSFYPHQVIDRPMYGEVIVKAKDGQLELTDADRERGENGTKTRLTTKNDTRRIDDVLASPNIDEVGCPTHVGPKSYVKFDCPTAETTDKRTNKRADKHIDIAIA